MSEKLGTGATGRAESFLEQKNVLCGPDGDPDNESSRYFNPRPVLPDKSAAIGQMVLVARSLVGFDFVLSQHGSSPERTVRTFRPRKALVFRISSQAGALESPRVRGIITQSSFPYPIESQRTILRGHG